MSTSDGDLFAGVDVGAGRVNAVLVEATGEGVFFRSRFEGDAAVPAASGASVASALVDFCLGARRVAVDAPGGLSAGAHRDDQAVAAKFRSGRCSEIPVAGVPPVPWVTPGSFDGAPGWMRTGFELWAALAGAGVEVVETFPAALFHRLNGGRWPPRKSSAEGRAARLSLLAGLVHFGGDGSGLAAWTHDDVDALAAALVAARGGPVPHSCPQPDGSALWLFEPGPGYSRMSVGLGPKMVS